jgi:hypothetical protein
LHWIKAWYARALALIAVSLSGPLHHAQGQTGDAEAAAWAAARRADTYEAYQRYLEEFPVGRHAGEAFQNMMEEALETDPGDPGGVGASPDLY